MGEFDTSQGEVKINLSVNMCDNKIYTVRISNSHGVLVFSNRDRWGRRLRRAMYNGQSFIILKKSLQLIGNK